MAREIKATSLFEKLVTHTRVESLASIPAEKRGGNWEGLRLVNRTNRSHVSHLKASYSRGLCVRAKRQNRPLRLGEVLESRMCPV